MAKILLLLFISLLSSCVSPVEVYIYSRGISDDEVERVANQLAIEGFEVKPSSIEIPEAITSNSIIYSPIILDLSDINLTRSVLTSMGYVNVSLVQGSEANHFYSKNNFGLYLINPNFIQNDNQELSIAENNLSGLSHSYYSDCQEIESQISLYNGGAAVLEIYNWDESRGRENSLTVSGEWVIDKEQIALDLFDQGTMEFQFEEFSGRDTYGRYKGINLNIEMNDTSFSNCNYKYTNYY